MAKHMKEAANLHFSDKTYHVEVTRERMRNCAKSYGYFLTDEQCDALAGYLDDDAFDDGSFEHYLDFDMIPGELLGYYEALKEPTSGTHYYSCSCGHRYWYYTGETIKMNGYPDWGKVKRYRFKDICGHTGDFTIETFNKHFKEA